MATVTKDFKIKSGLIVEGANATVNNYDVLTKKQDDQDYIVNLIGGTATSQNTPNTVVKRDGNGNFSAGTVTADLTGNVVGNVTADTVTLNDGASNSSVYANGSDLTVYGHNNLYLNTNSADIILQPDGYAKIYNEVIATQPYVDNAVAAEATSRDIAIGVEAAARDNAIATALSSANGYTDTAVANLVDSAPALLDTLNELAAALADNPNYATDMAAQLSTADSNAQGYASTAQTNAETYASGLVGQEVIDRNSAISTAINALITDDVEEGTVNLYFTAERAISAVGGTIGDAINALTTNDIEEGSSNLYFTDARAVSALEAVVPNFTEIDINSVATQVAATQSVAVASQVVAHQFANSAHRSAEYTVKVAHGSHTELSKVMITLDSSDNVAITEYAIVGTNGSASTISADVNAGNVRLLVTTANNNSIVTVVGTLIA
jgi:hypothetical protein